MLRRMLREDRGSLRAMKTNRRPLYFFATMLAATLAGSGYYAFSNRPPSTRAVAARIAEWPDGPRTAAALMMERYGPPASLASGTATWHEAGPWKRIAVHRDSRDRFLDQTVDYRVPYMAVIPLFEFGHDVRADVANKELSASSDSESLNLLALNLADEIATGKRTAQDATDVYAATARLAGAGKSSPYTETLQFQPKRTRPEDAWRKVIGY